MKSKIDRLKAGEPLLDLVLECIRDGTMSEGITELFNKTGSGTVLTSGMGVGMTILWTDITDEYPDEEYDPELFAGLVDEARDRLVDEVDVEGLTRELWRVP